jgi:heterodisulfide reductase subunit B
MRLESCFCPKCGFYNSHAGVVVSKQADEIARLREALEKIVAAEYSGGAKTAIAHKALEGK